MNEEINDLREQLLESRKILLKLNKEIDRLKIQVKYGGNAHEYNNMKNQKMLGRKLKRDHQLCLRRIEGYNNQLNELKKLFLSRNKEIQNLKKENEELKIKIKRNAKSKSPKKRRIAHVSDLRKSFGFNLKEFGNNNKRKKDLKINEDNEEELDTPGCSGEREDEFEKLKKSKIECETAFYKLQEMICNYYKDTDNQLTYITNYRNYLESINNQIRSFRQQLRVSVVGEENAIFDYLSGDKVNQLVKDIELTSNIINQINDLIYIIKNRTLKKGENMLRTIQTKLIEINNNKKMTYWFLSYRMDIIVNNIEDLKKLCQSLQRALNSIMIQRKEIEKNINVLKKN